MSLKNRIIGLAAVGAAALTLAPGALAKDPPAWTCDAPATTIFAPLKDDAHYQLVDDGTFENGAASWELSGGAQVVRDLDLGLPWLGAPDEHALEIGPGATALSPPICVTEASETFRFLSAAARAGDDDDNLKVEVIYLRKKTKEFKVKSPNLRGAASKKLKLSTGEFKQDSTVRLRFSTLEGATVRVDDVYMDPRMH